MAVILSVIFTEKLCKSPLTVSHLQPSFFVYSPFRFYLNSFFSIKLEETTVQAEFRKKWTGLQAILERQRESGGVIDPEVESNRFLIHINEVSFLLLFLLLVLTLYSQLLNTLNLSPAAAL